MKLPYYTQSDVTKLYDAVEESTESYASTETLAQHLATLGITCQIEAAYELSGSPPVLTGKSDAEDAVKLHRWIRESNPVIPRSVLADGRLWAALCHTTFSGYVTMRWRKDKENALPKSRIRSRFFARGEGQRSLVRNALARLFMAAELVVSDGDYTLVDALFIKQDIHQNFLERAIGGDAFLLREIAKSLKSVAPERLAKKPIQSYAKLINGAGAIKTLDQVREQDIPAITDLAFPAKSPKSKGRSQRSRK